MCIRDSVVVVTSTQIPHIVRRIVGQALGIPWGQVRIIKPYIGGGFGIRGTYLVEQAVNDKARVGAVRFDLHPGLDNKSGDELF